MVECRFVGHAVRTSFESSIIYEFMSFLSSFLLQSFSPFYFSFFLIWSRWPNKIIDLYIFLRTRWPRLQVEIVTLVVVLTFSFLFFSLLSFNSKFSLSPNTMNPNDFNCPGISEQKLLKNLIQETAFPFRPHVSQETLLRHLLISIWNLYLNLTESSEIINTRKLCLTRWIATRKLRTLYYQKNCQIPLTYLYNRSHLQSSANGSVQTLQTWWTFLNLRLPRSFTISR